jgi:hypothetical protein
MPAWAAVTTGAQPAWSFLQSGLSPYENQQVTPYVLTLQGSNNQGGLNVNLEPLSTGSPASQLWQLTADLRLLCAVGNDNVLTIGPDEINGVWGVQAATQLNPTTNVQHWDLSGTFENQLDNWHLGQCLTVTGGSPYGGPPLALASSSSDPEPSFLWYLMPASPLSAILAQAPVPFLAFTGNQLVSYQYINQQLGLGQGETPDFRGQYLNIGAALAQWMTDIGGYHRPDHVSESDWHAVVTQLNTEVTYVLSVQQLFINYNLWQTAQLADKGTILSHLIADAQMEQGTNVSGVGIAILQGALYTALEAIPVVGNVLGNVVNTAINAALAAQQISASPFQVTVSNLWSQLSSTFESVAGQTALMETAILSDRGKLQAVYPLTILTPGAPDSLAATALTDANLLAASTQGYITSAMQMLLPAQYQIYVYQDDNGDPVDDVPSYAQRVESSGNNLWTKYWIADSTDWDLIPSQQALQTDLWNNGVSQWDFFHGADGWGFATCYVYDYIVESADAVVVTITNQTPNLLTVQASVEQSYEGTIAGPSSGTVYPYESISLAAQMNNESGLPINVDFQIFDPNISTESAVGSFTATQQQPGLEGGWPTVSGQSSNNGYGFSPPICNQGAIQASLKDGYPGAVQLGFYLT